jgi:hypothetical protein
MKEIVGRASRSLTFADLRGRFIGQSSQVETATRPADEGRAATPDGAGRGGGTITSQGHSEEHAAMRCRRCVVWAVGASCLVMGATAARADGPAPASKEAPQLAALVETIDRMVAEKWAEAGVAPAAPADDAEFLRRVSLDIAGKIPTVAEVRAFLDDPAPDKRAKAVGRLLAGPSYVAHFTRFWKSLLLPEGDGDVNIQVLGPDFEAWLRQRVADNAGYDKIARELISLPMEGENGRRGVNPFERRGSPTPLAYYFAKEAKPENLAASTARTFLGIRIECAQCHDHPFARWTRDEFWGYAAFFGGVQKQGDNNQFGPIREIPDRRELAIPGTERVVQAAFLDGSEPQWKFKVSSRVTLADWMTSPENPYFARAAANRLWAHLFGTGLVDPVDDLSEANPPSHPELLDELARQFAAHAYDPKFLLRALTATRAYQLSSDAANTTSQDDPRLFSRMAVKGMTADQLYDSLARAAGLDADPNDGNPRFFNPNSLRGQIRAKFARRDEKPTETQTSILQALAMMNGRTIATATNLEQGATLGAVADAPFLDAAGKVEALYLAALGRKPRPDELSRMVAYLGEHGTEADGAFVQLASRVVAAVNRTQRPAPTSGLADVFWALLNSTEFMVNH